MDDDHGVRGLDEDAAALLSTLRAIEDQIVETPPRTLRGIAVKLRLLAALEEHPTDESEQYATARILLGLIRDIEAATVGDAS